jgi:hypothetical protein
LEAKHAEMMPKISRIATKTFTEWLNILICRHSSETNYRKAKRGAKLLTAILLAIHSWQSLRD